MPVFGLELPLVLVLAGLGLMIMEAISPGAHLIVLGVALLFAGLVGAVVAPLSGPIALAFMALFFGAAATYLYHEYDLYGDTNAAQTSDSSSLKGKTGRVVERVTGSEGRVKLESGGFNPYYQARALDEPIEEGAEVLVVDPGGGNVLTVMSTASASEDAIDRELARAARRDPDDGTDAGGQQSAGGGERSASPDGERSTATEADLESERSS